MLRYRPSRTVAVRLQCHQTQFSASQFRNYFFLFRKQGLRPSKLLVERDWKVWKSTEAVILAWLGGLVVKELVLLLATVRFCFFAVRPVSPVDATPLPQSIPLVGAPLVTLRSCLSLSVSRPLVLLGTMRDASHKASALVLFSRGPVSFRLRRRNCFVHRFAT